MFICKRRDPSYDLPWWNDLKSEDKANISQLFQQKKEYSNADIDDLISTGNLSFKRAEEYAEWYFDVTLFHTGKPF